ncbi:MAG: hypothetical protein ACM3XM_06330 [Mycobacterium leprae]
MRRLSGSEAFLASLAALAATGIVTTDRSLVDTGPPVPNRGEYALPAIPGLYGVKPGRSFDEMLGVSSPARIPPLEDRRRKH